MVNASEGIQRVQNGEHLPVLDTVIHTEAVFPILEQPGLAQGHELLGDIGLPLAQ